MDKPSAKQQRRRCCFVFHRPPAFLLPHADVWQQVQRLHDDILAVVLCASALPLATKLEQAPEACQAAVCSSAVDVRDGLSGIRLDGMFLHTCSAALTSMPDLQWMRLFLMK
jgi:hypothetical protein